MDLLSKEHFQGEIAAARRLMADMEADGGLHGTAVEVARACLDALRRGNKILFVGNGGSAADSQHLAAEFVSRFNFDRPGLPAIALTTDTSAITAISNDYGFDKVFSRQVQALGRRGDVLFAISTSGRSPNVLAAVSEAAKMGITTVGMTGAAGNALRDATRHCLSVPSTITAKIQEGHIVLGHAICGLVERMYFPEHHAPGGGS